MKTADNGTREVIEQEAKARKDGLRTEADRLRDKAKRGRINK